MNDDGRDVEALTNVMTMLAPPGRGPITDGVLAGEKVFVQIGCSHCHRPTLRSGLLHNMGSLGDGIAQGQATGPEMRTQPLWGLRNANRFMHDAATRSLEEAIRRHDGQGRAARDRFVELAADSVAQLLEFLRSL